MPLPQNLNTNEVKDKTGTEKQYLFHDDPGRSIQYALDTALPSLPSILTIQHRDVGTPGTHTHRRQSNVNLVDTFVSQVDNVTKGKVRVSITVDSPEGMLTSRDIVKDALAKVTSFVATTGTNTFLYDGTGTGAAALINGTL